MNNATCWVLSSVMLTFVLMMYVVQFSSQHTPFSYGFSWNDPIDTSRMTFDDDHYVTFTAPNPLKPYVAFKLVVDDQHMLEQLVAVAIFNNKSSCEQALESETSMWFSRFGHTTDPVYTSTSGGLLLKIPNFRGHMICDTVNNKHLLKVSYKRIANN